MKKYELITKTIAEALQASETVDGIMYNHSGGIALFYRLKDGREIPFIDTGYLSEEGIKRLQRRYKIIEKGA